MSSQRLPVRRQSYAASVWLEQGEAGFPLELCQLPRDRRRAIRERLRYRREGATLGRLVQET